MRKTPIKKSSKKRTPVIKARATYAKAPKQGLKGFVRGLRMDTARRETIGFVSGLIIFLLSIFTVISIVSLFFTKGADQAIVLRSSTADLVLGRVEVSNICGAQGALLADWVINGLFGLGSAFILFYLISISLKLMRAMQRIHPMKRLAFAGALCIWTSIFLGFITNTLLGNSYIFWGGIHGSTCADWLMRSVGSVGLIFILLVVAVIISLLFRSANIHRYHKAIGLDWIKRKEQVEEGDNSVQDKEASEEKEQNPPPERMYVQSPHKEAASEAIALDPTTDQNDSAAETAANAESKMTVKVAEGDELVAQSEVQDPPRNDPRYGLSGFRFPPLDILTRYEEGVPHQDNEEIEANKRRIIVTLESFKMRVTPKTATVGPTVTLYEVVPDAGIKISRIRSMEDDIAMSLKSEGIRIIAPMPGKGTIGIEVPNKTPQTVSMYSVLASRRFQEQKVKMELPIALGKTITNEAFLFDLAKMPHLLIAGATGQGKSVGLNALIASLLYSRRPEELKFVLVDPKMLEFSLYEGIERHYLAKLPEEDGAIITDMTKVVPTLKSLCVLMDERYKLLTSARVRNIKEYNTLILEGKLSSLQGHSFMPYIVVIVDEFADLIMTSGKEVESPITRIAQKARAAGIHMVIATQRPSTDIITGIIKANFPARIAFKVFSMIDSRTILDSPGANQLVGRGDMLFNQGKDTIRLQCAFIDTPECESLVDHIHGQESFPSAYLLPDPPTEGEEGIAKTFNAHEKDPLFDEVARMIVYSQQGSTSNIQRKFNIGYNRAGRLMDQLEGAGIVSAQDGSKPRQVLIQDESSLEALLERLH